MLKAVAIYNVCCIAAYFLFNKYFSYIKLIQYNHWQFPFDNVKFPDPPPITLLSEF